MRAPFSKSDCSSFVGIFSHIMLDKLAPALEEQLDLDPQCLLSTERFLID